MAHLDITHYKSLSKEEELAIENFANRIINGCTPIHKGFMDKAEAEKEHGFKLYQGGVVPGNSLRVVDIEGIDTEACCGTHCDSTAEVGWIKLIKTQRISDGIVRLYYVAHERAIEKMNDEQEIMNQLCDTWGIDQSQILPTATRFFNEYKKLSTVTKKQDQQILNLQVKYVLNSNEETKLYRVKSEQDSPTLYFSFLPQFAQKLKEQNKGLVFYSNGFILGLIGNSENEALIKELEATCKEMSSKPVKSAIKKDVKFDYKIKGQKPVVTKDISQFSITGADFDLAKVAAILEKHSVLEME
jgi:alanyl-tRNA synthetase